MRNVLLELRAALSLGSGRSSAKGYLSIVIVAPARGLAMSVPEMFTLVRSD